MVDDHQVAAGHVVGIGERAARDQGRAHGFKVTGKHDLKVHGLKFAGIGERFLGTPADGTEVPRQRKRKRGDNTLHASDAAQMVLNLMHKRSTFLRLRSASVAKNLKSQKAVWIEAWVDALKFEKTAQHQSGSDEQYEGEGYFRDDDKLA